VRILFNLLDCGLANNGGSDTIVRSANTLVDMGHEVSIIDNIPNRYTWGELKAEHRIIRGKDDIPKSDTVIHTGFKTVKRFGWFIYHYPKQFHWIRGWETWTYPEEYIVNDILEHPVVHIVNSIQLKRKLKKHGFKSHLVRPGYDFDMDRDIVREEASSYTVLGGLYSGKENKRATKRIDWIFKTVEKLKQDFKIDLWMFGIDEDPNNKLIRNYAKEPNAVLKDFIFNAVDIWLAPTELEGLHRPPVEAMLTECPVVGTNAELSGMADYLVHEETGLVADNNLDSFIDNVRRLVEDKGLRVKLGKQARQKILSLGNRETNMHKMVKVLEQYV
jgi:glycosyltransferase involved in cell wall biosynthesis